MKLPTNIILPLMVYIVTTMAEHTFLGDYRKPFELLRNLTRTGFEREARTSQYARDLEASQRVQSVVNSSVPFPCSLREGRSRERPTSVHMLRPGDIDVIGAIGDSTMAAFASMGTNLLNMVLEYRGASFAMGGEKTWREYNTLSNMLKEFNPNLIGYSLATSTPIDEASQFNAAESGAESADSMDMTKTLITRITSDRRVNITSDWKMIIISIGAVNWCRNCINDSPGTILERQTEHLIQTLRLIRDNLPRTFVNVVTAPNPTFLRHMPNKPIYCYFAQIISCGCVLNDDLQKRGPPLADIIVKWQQLEEKIANYEEFDRDDFTVVVQPMLNDAVLPLSEDGTLDYSLFALDCFHFSQKGHAILATNLWNNLVTPVGQKQTTITMNATMKCLNDESPYLYTNRNSRLN